MLISLQSTAYSLQFVLRKSVVGRRKTNQLGQSLIELVIAIAIVAIIMPVLFYGMITSTRAKAQETQSLGANAMLKEGVEAVRAAREVNWASVAANGSYHPLIVGNQWTLTANSENINQFTRVITIADTVRDTSGNIAATGGVIDPSTKKVTVTVSWTTPYTSSLSSTLYLTRYFNNASFAQPATVNFSTYSATTSSNVTVDTNTVTLAPAGLGLYAAIGTYESTTFDAGANVAFNRLAATFDQPANTQTGLQLAAKSSTGSCSGVTFSSTDFVGPNNDPAQYFTSAGTGVLNLNIQVPTITDASFQNPGRCFRYRVLFTPSTNYLLTPTLQNIQVNYSP